MLNILNINILNNLNLNEQTYFQTKSANLRGGNPHKVLQI